MYLILGFGISNKAVAHELIKRKYPFIIVINKEEKEEAIKYHSNVIEYEYLKYLDLTKVKYVIKSPGIPSHNHYVKFLRSKHLKIINEIELTYILTKRVGIYIGVSGSVGKSTVVSLLYALVSSKRENVILAGNIGVPLISYIDKINPKSLIILEVSSFQLEDFMTIKFHIALLTNIYDNHLDVYKKKELYYNSKFLLTNNQTKKDYFVLNLDNQLIRKYLLSHYFLSGLIDYKSGFEIKNNILYYYKMKICDLSCYLLKGEHNLDNLKAVIVILNLLCIDLDINALRTFTGLKYHLSEHYYRGICLVNDSKSTCVSSLIEAINTYKSNNLILLFGGYNKNLDFTRLENYKLKSIICFGKLANEINIRVDYKFSALREATFKALEIAKEGDTILFSPGCASFDEFSSYIERGEKFDLYVNEYENE